MKRSNHICYSYIYTRSYANYFSFSVKILFLFLVLECLGMHAWCQSRKKVVKSPLFGSNNFNFPYIFHNFKGWSLKNFLFQVLSK